MATVRSKETRIRGSRALVLVLQNGGNHLHAVSKHIRGHFAVSGVSRLASARKLVEGRSIAGAILDAAVADGSGFDLIDELRQQTPNLPLLFVTAQLDDETLNRAHLVNVPIVARDTCAPNLQHFSAQVATQLACTRDGLADILLQLTHEKRLSAREAQLLAVAVHGIPRAHLARRLGISENTIKSQIRSLLDKTQKASLSEVIWLVHSQSEAP